LFHLDLYRLETVEQISAAGLEEYLRPEGVTVIEWAERWLGSGSASLSQGTIALDKYRQVRIDLLGETERSITYEDFGA